MNRGDGRLLAGGDDALRETLPYRRFSPAERNEWRDGIIEIYRRMRKKTYNGEWVANVNGLTFVVLPTVYAPGFFTDTEWFAQRLPAVVGRSSLLEIGTGTGAIAVFCAQAGATVVATDVNPNAVRNAAINFARYGVTIETRCGVVYQPLADHEKFDAIFWAHPFNNSDTPITDMLLRSGMDYNYNGLREYISGAARHLKPTGKLLLGTGNTADCDTIIRTAGENGYRVRILDETQTVLEPQGAQKITYVLCELVQSR
jgi:methylase of polypeptide subunit release factors